MRCWMLALSLIVGCGQGAPLADSYSDMAQQAAPQAAGPIDRTLEVSQTSKITPREQVRFEVSGAQPGQSLALLISPIGPGAAQVCPLLLNRNCPDLEGGMLTPVVLADADGRGFIEMRVPRSIDPASEYWVQALAARDVSTNTLPNLSNLITLARFDMDGDGFDTDADCDDEDASNASATCLDSCFAEGGDADGDAWCDDTDPCPADADNHCVEPCYDDGGDTDFDGVCDNVDPCPDDHFDHCTEPCFQEGGDWDGDGVCDYWDPCITDPTNACEEPCYYDGGDSDADGTCDDIDVCPYDASDTCQ